MCLHVCVYLCVYLFVEMLAGGMPQIVCGHFAFAQKRGTICHFWLACTARASNFFAVGTLLSQSSDRCFVWMPFPDEIGSLRKNVDLKKLE